MDTWVLDLNAFDPRSNPGQKNVRAQEAYLRQQQRNRLANIDYAPVRVRSSQNGGESHAGASFGSRMRKSSSHGAVESAPTRIISNNFPMELSWMPSERSGKGDDNLLGDGERKKKKGQARGVETFGAGMEKGHRSDKIQLSEAERRGRTQRRQGMRSGSKNTFRKM
jgi:ribosome biogenesis protein ENP2